MCFKLSMQLQPMGNQAAASVDAGSGLRRVLLVDDEAGILDLFGMILRNADIRCERLSTAPPDSGSLRAPRGIS